jgi:Lrp/AsnC ligand binding domain
MLKVEPGCLHKVANAISDLEIVSEMYSVVGDYDLLAKIYVESFDDLADMVNERIQKVPSTRTTCRSRSGRVERGLGDPSKASALRHRWIVSPQPLDERLFPLAHPIDRSCVLDAGRRRILDPGYDDPADVDTPLRLYGRSPEVIDQGRRWIVVVDQPLDVRRNLLAREGRGRNFELSDGIGGVG